MAIKVQFEIGHTATVKTKRTPEGFTHDWELYVQGVNKADISAFVDKVVFNLHDSFPKPKRSIKEPPYVIKESGYAGFLLNIDIYFRNRDEPKRVTYSYDLDLQHEGPPHHRCEIKKFIFEVPSEDFRQKLVKGGGIAVSAVVGGALASDDKSLDMNDSRSQMVGKPKLSSDANSSASSTSSKKHKQRPDDSKLNTFANLFGTPITKSAPPKFSPDPKVKTANGGGGGATGPSGPSVPGKGKDKSGSTSGAATAGTVSSGPVATGAKDKEKTDKKEKHKQLTSPHKDKLHEEKESKKKSDGKHDKREEKKKDKKDKEKDRDRVKEKSSKRSLSPKSAATSVPSPKRPSPVRSSSAASRDDTSAKSTSKISEGEKRGSSSSSGKKSKKEKKSHEKEREHKEKHRSDAKESAPSASAAAVTASQAVPTAAPNANAAQPAKSSNTTVGAKIDLNSNKNQKVAEKDLKKTEQKPLSEKESTPVQSSDKKSSTEKDKKSHKHKKKDKNKEKEKEKEKDKDKDKEQISKKSNSSKDKKDKKDKTVKNEASASATATSNSNSSVTSKKTTATTEMDVPTETSNITKSSSSAVSGTSSSTKTITTTNKPSNNVAASMVSSSNNSSTTNTGTASSTTSGLQNVPNDLSDVDSLNSESLQTVSHSNSDKVAQMHNSDSSNSSFPELPVAASKAPTVFQTPANPQPTPPTTPSANSAPATIAEPNRPQAQSVTEKKPHRSGGGTEKSKAEKTAEKEDKKRRRNSTAVNTFVEPPLKQIKKDLKQTREKSQSPLLRTEDKQTFLPPPATTSALPIQNTPVTALNLEYLSELQELHQKIMTLQDNEELQQVVEMIAATGRYEITSKTFDFDLCKLDRLTVQRLQDFFATSVS